jgi:hypothetical protein
MPRRDCRGGRGLARDVPAARRLLGRIKQTAAERGVGRGIGVLGGGAFHQVAGIAPKRSWPFGGISLAGRRLLLLQIVLGGQFLQRLVDLIGHSPAFVGVL